MSTTEGREETPAGTGFESEAWLEACRRMVAGQRLLFGEAVTIPERDHYEGLGEGGDRTLRLDRQCEDLVFAELEVLGRNHFDLVFDLCDESMPLGRTVIELVRRTGQVEESS